MINFLTGLALVGAAVTAIACAIAKLIIENGKCRINDCPQFLARKSLGGGGSILHSPFSIHTAVFVFFAAIATLSAQKSGTNEPPNGALPPRSMPPAPVVAPVAVDSAGFSVPTNMPPVTNLCFWGVCKCTNSVSLGLAWPVAISLANDCIDLYGHWSLASNGWTRLAEVDVGSAISNAVVELPFAYFPTNAMEETAFFAAADRHDSDGDGLPDAFERLVSGSSPSSSDTDGDGLSDGDEMGEGSDPLSADSDGDGLDDAAERGSVRVLPSFEWVDTTGMQTTYGMVPDYTSWFRVGACSILNLAQGTSVCGLPCWSVMAFEDGFASVLASGDTTFLVYPCVVFPLNEAGYNYGTYLIAPYWADLRLRYGDTNSFMRSGIAADGAAVVEWHNARRNELSNDSISFQVVVPGGTGSVVRVNYLSSDFWMDGSGGAVVGVHNKRLATTNGVYCLAWDFAERGPILPQTTVEYRFGIGTNPLLADTDGDGLSDGEENSLGTNPLRPDTDGDGLSDVQELALGTSPTNADTDGDGLFDGWEAANQLNPLSSAGNDGADGDIDGDGLSNLQEQAHGGNPRNADTDGDGLADAQEVQTGTSLYLADTDHDGLSDALESSLNLNPLQPDTDGDDMNDGWEYRHRNAGFDPAVDNATDTNPNNNIGADPDNDGLTNGEECEWGTNPSGQDSDGDGRPDGYDTDGDGVGDGAEVAQNSDPTDASDGGLPNSRIPLSFYFGDPSGSHSEKYRLTVTPTVGIGTRPASFSWLNENYGECETKTAMLKPGWRYEVRLFHAGTNGSGSGYPDYDYELNFTTNALPVNVVVQDPDGLFGTDDTSTAFGGEGKVATIYVLAPPAISAPSAIGVNNDDDNGNGTPDWEDVGAVAGDDDLAELHISVLCPSGAYGTLEVTPLIGATDGTMWKDIGRTRQLDMPEIVPVSAGVTNLAYFVEGSNPSSRYEVEGVHAVFRCGGIALTNEFRFTFVERIAEPITTERSGGQIVNPCCAVIGEATKLKVEVLPSDFPESKISWRVVSGSGSFSDATGREAEFVASGAEDEDVVVQVDVGDCPGHAPQFTMRTTTMHEVKIYPCVISRVGRPPPVTVSQINTMLDEVNVIYRQVGLHFSLGASLMCVTNEIWSRDGLIDNGVSAQIRDEMSGKDGLEVYFIEGQGNKWEPLGQFTETGVILRKAAFVNTLAHEIGHACGWGDIYCSSGDDVIGALYEGVKQSWMPMDWNNGTGCRFYDQMMPQYQAINMVLMHGKGGNLKCDIPLGSVYGKPANGDLGNVSVGRNTMMTTSPKSL